MLFPIKPGCSRFHQQFWRDVALCQQPVAVDVAEQYLWAWAITPITPNRSSKWARISQGICVGRSGRKAGIWRGSANYRMWLP